jgi:4-hydroxybenzoate polyprenyltransferase
MTKGDRIRIVVHFILGMVLALLAATVNTNAGFAFAQSAWVLPTVALTFIFGEWAMTFDLLKDGERE